MTLTADKLTEFESAGFKTQIDGALATVHVKRRADVPRQFSLPMPEVEIRGSANRLQLAIREWENENPRRKEFRDAVTGGGNSFLGGIEK